MYLPSIILLSLLLLCCSRFSLNYRRCLFSYFTWYDIIMYHLPIFRWVLYEVKLEANTKIFYYPNFGIYFNSYFKKIIFSTEEALTINKRIYQKIVILLYRMVCLLNALNFYWFQHSTSSCVYDGRLIYVCIVRPS